MDTIAIHNIPVVKSKYGPELTLCRILRPLFHLVRFLGLAPFNFVEKYSILHLEPSTRACICSLCSMLINTYMVMTVTRDLLALNRKQKVQHYIEICKVLLNYIVLMMELVRSITTRQQLIKVWDRIQVFDESLQLLLGYDEISSKKRLPKSHTYQSMIIHLQRCVWIIFAISTVGWTAVNVLGMYAYHETYLRNISYMIPYVLTFIVALKFCGLVYLINQRLSLLIDYLSHKRGKKFRESDEDETTIEMIETMLRQLERVCEYLNGIYTWPLLYLLYNIFCHLLSNSYSIALRFMIRMEHGEHWPSILCRLSWFFMFSIQLGLIHLMCHSVSLKKSDLFHISREVRFTAADCFQINLGTLASTVKHLVTYLVILLQMDPDSGIPHK
ncbi:hypothetical protein QAD02_016639 [Eretmocerus hayati]|uniref:Uncharacterized protein n=1 Tax=Eretmocerus hayati TaxID=131215 RepID=A0ACC2PBN9_9HYME|nr:hypothetical protein QAD02_016639 [Eretmocerus hayati]